jgi:hypothetical protein
VKALKIKGVILDISEYDIVNGEGLNWWHYRSKGKFYVLIHKRTGRKLYFESVRGFVPSAKNIYSVFLITETSDYWRQVVFAAGFVDASPENTVSFG